MKININNYNEMEIGKSNFNEKRHSFFSYLFLKKANIHGFPEN